MTHRTLHNNTQYYKSNLMIIWKYYWLQFFWQRPHPIQWFETIDDSLRHERHSVGKKKQLTIFYCCFAPRNDKQVVYDKNV